MERSSHCDNVLALGKALVRELNLDKSVDIDTFSRWMAHYIAELIKDTRNTEGEQLEKLIEHAQAAIAKIRGN